LKPTNVDALWVHVTCAWFQPQVAFASDEFMEPAVGILNIQPLVFMKVCYVSYYNSSCLSWFHRDCLNMLHFYQMCVICRQIHGSCTQCYRCSTYYHATCASRAGYRMEVELYLLLAADTLIIDKFVTSKLDSLGKGWSNI
jgi:hypothetical protein